MGQQEAFGTPGGGPDILCCALTDFGTSFRFRAIAKRPEL
jgi:hypothetical protein